MEKIIQEYCKMVEEFDRRVLEFKKNLAKELFLKCSDEQKDFFNSLYDSITEKDIIH